MKRTPLRRGGPLRRRTPLRAQQRRTSGLSPVPLALTRRRRKPDIPAKVRKAVRARSTGWCEAMIPEVCNGRARHMHHIRRRGQGGAHVAENLLHLCTLGPRGGGCHAFIHAHPTWSIDHGYLAGARP